MSQSRFYLDHKIDLKQELVLSKEVSHHIVAVLRKQPGQTITVFNGDGGEYLASIQSIEKKIVKVVITEFIDVNYESPLEITLAQGISKGQKMDYTLQKSVELGVSRIIPIQNRRSSIKIKPERIENKLQHWRNIVIGACEQSGRNQIPEVLPPMSLEQWLELDNNELKLLLAPGAKLSFSSIGETPHSLSLLIGSEGGLNDDEIQLAIDSGYQSVRLGSRILRTETAALVALSVCQGFWGDLMK